MREFQEEAKQRFGSFGIRIVETRIARVRLFLRSWDSRDGAIAWEGMEEVVYSRERVNEEPVTFQKAIDRAAHLLVRRMP